MKANCFIKLSNCLLTVFKNGAILVLVAQSNTITINIKKAGN